ncbi:MAG TPA: hypothetical protein PKZ41_04895, partial [Candidatus Omnitrophota bacterium]|nr:hypothetical protein [Candidatus Omnitrophota bacterium]
MKRKHFPVILFSSGIVVVVFLSTLFGFSLYTQFKKDSLAAAYRDSIYRITADIFRKDVVFSGVEVKISDKNAQGPVFEAVMKNNSSRVITFLIIELCFSDSDGKVLYKEWIRPLAGQGFDGVLFSAGTRSEGEVIVPGESFRLRHVMRNCPESVVRRASR